MLLGAILASACALGQSQRPFPPLPILVRISDCASQHACKDWGAEQRYEPDAHGAFFDAVVGRLLTADATLLKAAGVLWGEDMVVDWPGRVEESPRGLRLAPSREEAVKMLQPCGPRNTLVTLRPGAVYDDRRGALRGIEIFIDYEQVQCSGAPRPQYVASVYGVAVVESDGIVFYVTVRSVV